MGKIGKIFLIAFVLFVIAVPLGFLIKHNFTQKLAKITEQGIDLNLGLNSLNALDKANDIVELSNQTNEEISQIIEDTVSTTTQEVSSSTIIE